MPIQQLRYPQQYCVWRWATSSNIKWFEGLGEYRIDWGPGYRIYLLQEGKRLIILFGGGDKSSQKHDIKQAKKLIAEYKSRKNATQHTR